MKNHDLHVCVNEDPCIDKTQVDGSGPLGGGELAFMYGYSGGNFYLRDAASGIQLTIPTGLPNSSLGLEVRLVVDPNANAGNGAASLSWRDAGTTGAYTDLDGTFANAIEVGEFTSSDTVEITRSQELAADTPVEVRLSIKAKPDVDGKVELK